MPVSHLLLGDMWGGEDDEVNFTIVPGELWEGGAIICRFYKQFGAPARILLGGLVLRERNPGAKSSTVPREGTQEGLHPGNSLFPRNLRLWLLWGYKKANIVSAPSWKALDPFWVGDATRGFLQQNCGQVRQERRQAAWQLGSQGSSKHHGGWEVQIRSRKPRVRTGLAIYINT